MLLHCQYNRPRSNEDSTLGAKVQRQMRGGAESNIECGANRFSWLVTVAENRFNRAPLSNYHWPFPIFPHTEEGTLAAHTFSNSSINFSALPSLCIHHDFTSARSSQLAPSTTGKMKVRICILSCNSKRNDLADDQWEILAYRTGI